MQCPNCKMNIKDDAKYCIHCGYRFDGMVSTTKSIESNEAVQGTNATNNNVTNNTNINSNNSVSNNFITNPTVINQTKVTNDDRERYLKAYFGKRYEKLLNEKFSVGVFFLGWLWLVFHKLYRRTFQFILSMVGLSFLFGVINAILTSFLPRSAAPVLGIAAIVELIFLLKILISYCKDHSAFCFEKADTDIDSIIRTTDNEEERIKLCARYGRPNYILFIFLILQFTILPTVVTGIVANRAIDNSKTAVFADTITSYKQSARTSWMAGNIICKDASHQNFEVSSENIKTDGKYYVVFSTGEDWKDKFTNIKVESNPVDNATNLVGYKSRSPWNASDIYGVMAIERSGHYIYIGIAAVDSFGHGVSGDKLPSNHSTTTVASNEIERNATLSNANVEGYECMIKK